MGFTRNALDPQRRILFASANSISLLMYSSFTLSMYLVDFIYYGANMVLSDSYPIYGVYGKDDSEGLSTRNHRSRRAFIEEWISAGEKQRRGRKIGASTFDTPKDSEQMNRVVK